MIFCIFYQVNLTGSGLFKKDWCRNRLLTWKKVQQNHFYYWKNEKIPEVPSSGPKWFMTDGGHPGWLGISLRHLGHLAHEGVVQGERVDKLLGEPGQLGVPPVHLLKLGVDEGSHRADLDGERKKLSTFSFSLTFVGTTWKLKKNFYSFFYFRTNYFRTFTHSWWGNSWCGFIIYGRNASVPFLHKGR